MLDNWKKLNKEIVSCRKCRRLVKFREKIAKNKTKRFINENYWGKPVLGYGNKKGKLIILGLAPAAHGGNRTGRVFTGDKSADFLINCLHKVKFVNQPTSTNKNDGLKMLNSYMTPVLKCVPPEDKPKSDELTSCFYFLKKEINLLNKSKIFLALGKIAFDTCVKFFKKYKYINSDNKLNFSHGISYKINDELTLIGSYHPSPRNVNTGRIDSKKMINLLIRIKKKLNIKND
ncbi:MAG: hypothetical protein CFH26_00772 [Alphaproteobacteria bacterium MarineAlpha6_Bin4]|nr:MAG: hypothetical protein CFH26_00772 [Alphaproteobacteria bacterium MarineAlpha6_Bin4]